MQKMAAEIMAAAVVELFPDVTLIKGGRASCGFYYDFIFPFTVYEHHLNLIEERMRAVVKKKNFYKSLEMMPLNAAAFLEHLGQPVRAQAARECRDALIELVQIGDFVDICKMPHTPPYVFSLQRVLYPSNLKNRHVDDRVQRIEGVAAADKEGLKKIVKMHGRYDTENHIAVGKKRNLFEQVEEGGWIWYPQGQRLRRRLISLWEEEHRDFLCVSRSHSASIPFSLLQTSARVAEWLEEENEGELEGLFTPDKYTFDRAYIECLKEKALEESISSLQFMSKISKILHFEPTFAIPCLQGKNSNMEVLAHALQIQSCAYVEDGECGCLEMRVRDHLDREWTLGTLRIVPSPREGKVVLVRSSFGSLERIIALLLETQQEVQF